MKTPIKKYGKSGSMHGPHARGGKKKGMKHKKMHGSKGRMSY